VRTTSYIYTTKGKKKEKEKKKREEGEKAVAPRRRLDCTLLEGKKAIGGKKKKKGEGKRE